MKQALDFKWFVESGGWLFSFESDHRHQTELTVLEQFPNGGLATVSKSVSKTASGLRLATTAHDFLKLAKTRVLLREEKRTGLSRD